MYQYEFDPLKGSCSIAILVYLVYQSKIGVPFAHPAKKKTIKTHKKFAQVTNTQTASARMRCIASQGEFASDLCYMHHDHWIYTYWQLHLFRSLHICQL